jgi:hypothetical protein
VGDAETGPLEGFNSYCHRRVPKFVHHHLYKERIYLIGLKWNTNNISRFVNKSDIPEGLWGHPIELLQTWQHHLGLLVHPNKTMEQRKKRSPQITTNRPTKKTRWMKRREQRAINLKATTSFSRSSLTSPAISLPPTLYSSTPNPTLNTYEKEVEDQLAKLLEL